MSDKADYIIDLKTGWPRHVHFERLISSGRTRRVELITFNRVLS